MRSAARTVTGHVLGAGRKRYLVAAAAIGCLLIAGSAMAATREAAPAPLSSDARPTPRAEKTEKTDVSTLRGKDFIPGEVIVRFDAAVDESSRAQGRADAGARLIRRLPLAGAEHLKITDGRSVAKAITALQNRPGVAYAQPNYVYTASASPNDPLFENLDLWALRNTGKDPAGEPRGVVDADIDAPAAWDVITDSAVTVAVVDSGIDYNHPDLAPNIWANPGESPGNGVDDDGNGKIDDPRGWDFINNDNDPQDPNGHGTHVAGTIGAAGNNDLDTTGVAWNVDMIPVRVLNAVGLGSSVTTLLGYEYAVAEGATVINASLGNPAYDQATRDVIAAADDALFVVAAGNASSDNDTTPVYPCNYDLPNIICVAATDRNDALASFSNVGATTVDLAAPGLEIWSTFPPSEQVWSEDFEGDLAGWTAEGRWGFEATPNSTHLSDSVGGPYSDGENDNSIAQRAAVDLSGKSGCRMTYVAQWALGAGDVVQVQGATSDTGPWQALRTHTGASSSTSSNWEAVNVDLQGPLNGSGVSAWNFNGGQLHLRFVLGNPVNGGSGAGIFFDNFVLDCKPETTAANAGVKELQGTSMATPHVAGAAALVWTHNPALTPAQLKARLMDTGDAKPALTTTTVSGKRLNLYRALGHNAPYDLNCRDGNGVGQPVDTEVNPTFGVDAAEVYTCTMYTVIGDPVPDVTVNFENLGGANDADDNATGGPSGTADSQCTTGGNGTCTFTVAPAEGAPGAATLCFWVDVDLDGGFDAAGAEDDGGLCTGEGVEEDLDTALFTDVAQITWTDPDMFLDCDDSTGNDTQVNQLAQQPTESYLCRVTGDSGEGLAGLWIDLENMAGANDADDDATGGPGDQADGGCVAQTDANGECTVAVSASEDEPGTADICFWVDHDGDHGFDISSTGRSGSADGGYCDDANEPWDEAESIDREDKTRLAWTDCTAVWDGSRGTNNWQDTHYVNGSLVDTNWTYLVQPHAAVFPTTSDRVCIGEGAVVNHTSSDTIGALDNDGTLNQSDGALTVQGLGRPSELGTLNLTGGTIGGAGPLSVDKIVSWSAGYMAGAGVTSVLPGGELRVTGTGARITGGRVVDNAGTVEFVGTSAVGTDSGTGRMHNLDGGVVVKTGAGTGSFCAVSCIAFDNDGLARSDEGILLLNSSGTGAGDWATTGAGQVRFAGSTFTLGDGTTYSGTGVSVQSGTLNLHGNHTVAAGGALALDAGVVTGTHTIHGPGVVNWAGVSLLADATHNVTTLASSAHVNITDHAMVTSSRVVNNHGTIEFTGDTAFGTNSGVGTVNNLADGTVLKSGGAATAHFCYVSCVAFNNHGTVSSQVGTLRLNTGTSTGTFAGTAGGTLKFDANYTLGDTTDFTGPNIELSAASTTTATGTITFDATAAVTLAGTLTGTHTLTGPGTLNWTGGAISGASTTTIGDDTTVNINANVIINGGRVVNNHGTINFTGDHAVGTNSAAGTIVNQTDGLIAKTAGTGTAHFTNVSGVALQNNGTVGSAAGNLSISGGFDAYNSATKTLTKGVYEAINGATITVPGADIRTNEAEVILRGATAALRPGATGNALSQLTTNAGSVQLTDGAVLTTTAALTSTGTLHVGAGSTLTAPSFLLEGGLLSGSGTLAGDVVNTGTTVSPGSSPGLLSIDGDYSQSDGANLLVEVAGTDAGSFDALDVTGSATLGGTLTVATLGDYVPAWTHSLPIVTSPTPPTVSFDAINGGTLPSGVAYDVERRDGAAALITVDSLAPTSPGLSSTSHPLSTWTRDATVALTLQGAADSYSGVAGFSVLWDTTGNTPPPQTVTDSGAPTTVTSPELADGDNHWVHVRTVDRQGNWSGAVHLGPFFVDTTAPSKVALTTPTASDWLSLQATAGDVPKITTTWAAGTDGASGVDSYRVAYASIARSATELGEVTYSPSLTSRILTLATVQPGATYCFQIETTDHAGNRSLGAKRCSAVPLDETALKASSVDDKSQWKSIDGNFYRGTAARTSQKGATLRVANLQTKRLALVATRCPDCGTVQVLWNGEVVRTVNLEGDQANKVIYPVTTFKNIQGGTLVVKVSSPTGTPVTIDALGAGKL